MFHKRAAGWIPSDPCWLDARSKIYVPASDGTPWALSALALASSGLPSSQVGIAVLANPPKKLNLRHRLDSQAPFVRMLWRPFSTFCSAGILSALQDAVITSERRHGCVLARGRNGERGICFSFGISNPFGISTSIFKDLKLLRINTCRKIIVCIRPLWSSRCFCGSPSGRFIRRPNESCHIAPSLPRLRPEPREAIITTSPLRAKVLAANVMDIRSFAAPAKSSGAFARQQSGPRDVLFGQISAISLESALAKNHVVTHVQSALAKQKSLTLLK